MSIRRAIWTDDHDIYSCTKCKVNFDLIHLKHHCRKCGLVFCNECTIHNVIIPKDEIVLRPSGNWLYQNPLISTEDDFRHPQRVCDSCFYSLRDVQGSLRQSVSRANQETLLVSTTNTTTRSTTMPNLPSIDFYLENEIKKAAMMLYTFKNTLGEEKIPRELIDIAQGVVFFTIIKVGFVFTGRYGTGLIVAKLPNGTWSAPSAVQMSGLGWGLQIGAELTDVLLILSTDSAVNAFKSRAQLAVGAELGVSVGPIGRSIESDVTAGNKGAAHAFSYAQSKGLFVGASLEASAIASRPDVNRAFYGEQISVSTLLDGTYPSPKGANVLYRALNEVLFGGQPTTVIPAAVPGYSSSELQGSSSNLEARIAPPRPVLDTMFSRGVVIANTSSIDQTTTQYSENNNNNITTNSNSSSSNTSYRNMNEENNSIYNETEDVML